jgi:hypothetical protein
MAAMPMMMMTMMTMTMEVPMTMARAHPSIAGPIAPVPHFIDQTQFFGRHP